MKYENLMEIPYGYKMQLAQDRRGYSKGTKIIRSHGHSDDEKSVVFTFPDGAWDYLDKQQLEEISKEKKGMKGSDKVMVELTGYQVATIYALIGKCQFSDKSDSYGLYKCLGNILSMQVVIPEHKDFPEYITFSKDFEEKLYKALLEPENPVLTEAQKKALELKETIAKAQKQLEELEKQI